jgi:peptide/nickel transport system ATP-binding protein
MNAGRIVERGPAEEVTQNPTHEYTQLLIASAPDPDTFARRASDEIRPVAPAQAPPVTVGDQGGAAMR